MRKLEDVVFVVDNLRRDMASLSLIGFHLEQAGHRVHYIGVTDLSLRWMIWRDCLIVLGKPFLNGMPFRLMKRRNCKFGVVHTEGAMGSAYLEDSSEYLDLVFFWNIHDEKLFQKRFPNFKGVCKTLGTPRTDLLYITQFLEKSQKSRVEGRPSLLVTSPGGYLDRTKKDIAHKRKQMLELSDGKIDLDIFLKNERLSKKMIADFVFNVHSLGYDVLFKPHPNESQKYWLEKFSGLASVTFVESSIEKALKSCSVLIGMTYCQTLIDARLSGKLSLGLDTPLMESFFPNQWLQSTPYRFSSASNAINFLEPLGLSDIKRLVSMDTVSRELHQYVERFFFVVDGCRARAYSEAISNFLEREKYNDLRSKEFKIVNEILYGITISLKSIVMKCKLFLGLYKLRHRNSFSNNKVFHENFLDDYKAFLRDRGDKLNN